MAGKSVPWRSFRREILKIRMQRVLPGQSSKYLIMEGSDVVARACEPPHVVDHPGRVDRHAAAGAGPCLRTGGLAGPDGALRQRLPGRGSNRYAVAYSVPEDDRAVRPIVRCPQQGRGG